MHSTKDVDNDDEAQSKNGIVNIMARYKKERHHTFYRESRMQPQEHITSN